MTQDRNYPLSVIQDRLLRDSQDLRSVKAMEWLADVVELLRREAASVPPPAERMDTIPKYNYPR